MPASWQKPQQTTRQQLPWNLARRKVREAGTEEEEKGGAEAKEEA